MQSYDNWKANTVGHRLRSHRHLNLLISWLNTVYCCSNIFSNLPMCTLAYLYAGSPDGVHKLEEQMKPFCMMLVDSSKASQNLWLPQTYHCHSSNHCSHWKVSFHKTLFSGTQQQDQRQWAQIEKQWVPYEHQEPLFHCQGDWALAQAVLGGCRVSTFKDTWKPPGHGPE